MKKKLIGIFTTLVLCSSIFVGCNGGGNDYSLTEKNKVDGIAEYQIKNIEIVDLVEPSIPNQYSTYYKPSSVDKKLLDIEIDVTNLQSSEVNFKDLIDVTLGRSKLPEVNKVLEDKDGGNIGTSNESIKPNETRKVHFVYEADTKAQEETLPLEVTINKKTYRNSFNISTVQYERQSVKAGDTIVKNGFAESKLISFEQKEKIEPSNPTGYYTYYQARAEGKVLNVLTVEVKNLSNEALDASKILGVKDESSIGRGYSSAIIEEGDGSNLKEASTIKVEPNSSVKIMVIIETKADNTDSYILTLGGDKYILTR